MLLSEMDYAEDLKKFTPPTERVTRLKQRVLDTKPELCIERGRIVTQADKEFGALPPGLKWAMVLERVLDNMTIFIDDDELIVGNQSRKICSAPLFPEISADFILEEIDTISSRPADTFHVREEEKEEIKEIAKYWHGRCHEFAVNNLITEPFKLGEEMGVFDGIHIRSSDHGHIAANHAKVLNKGLSGIITDTENVINNLNLTSADDVNKLPFLRGSLIACKAAIRFAKRYSDLAKELAENEKNPKRKAELTRIYETCKWIPANKPRTFYEAVQLTTFLQIILQIEQNGHSISIGRFDQNLYPFYKADIDDGRITAREAQEILDCFFVKLRTVNKVRPWGFAKFATGYPVYQNLTIGGQHVDGTDATNPISYLCLNAMENVRFPEPNLIARYHSGTPDEFLVKCVETISLGFGMPALINDDVIIKSLEKRGVEHDDAMNYNAVGCIEVDVAGKWGHRCSGMTMTNFTRLMEMTLRGGTLPGYENSFMEKGKALEDCTSFDEVMEEWRRENEICARMCVEHDVIVDENKKEYPNIFLSTLVDDCIERGKTILEGGTVYDMNSGIQLGVSCMGNSFAAVKHLIFDEKTITGKELINILDNDFEGPEGELFRQYCLNKIPKYGNDNDYVDDITVKAYETYMDIIDQYHTARYGRGPIGCCYYPCTVTISSNVPAGHVSGATPDGRKAGVPVSEGVSPHSGTDVNGPTSVMKSVTKFPTERVTGGQLLNLKFSPSIMEKEGTKENVVNLIKTFGDLKGWHVQVNVVSGETLKAAQKNPEEYRNLMVRVAGYCALFTDLDEHVQNEIIRRTEHVAV